MVDGQKALVENGICPDIFFKLMPVIKNTILYDLSQISFCTAPEICLLVGDPIAE